MVLDQVKTIIADTLNCEEGDITLTSSITEDFGADSLEMVELAMALEDAFDIAIAEKNMLRAHSRRYCKLHRKQVTAQGRVCRRTGGRPCFVVLALNFK